MGLVAGYTGRAREGQTGCEATEWVVGDIGEVPGRGGGGTRRVVMTAGERGGSDDTGVVGGHGQDERDWWGSIGAGAGSASVTVHGAEDGACDVHGEGTGRADGMRGDGVGSRRHR